ncbi:hypothetical protein B0H15DRAFT_957016 [Mycena belliarum]|uniref:Uncharacterized protein n=1 Tax=Mycena belliarum TaxID=1033014 RepID=A0AAD6TT16_9AGAR|nr:hypothetical protein B0H15DRAFT_957016 [Mycena belliae]
MAKDGKILRSRSYWADFHQARAARRARANGTFHDHNSLGPLQAQAPIYTFVPNRVAPLVTVVQNNGTLVTRPMAILDVDLVEPGPARAPVPAALTEIGILTHRRRAVAIADRAKMRLRQRPSDDEVLLARLASCPSMIKGRKAEVKKARDRASARAS